MTDECETESSAARLRAPVRRAICALEWTLHHRFLVFTVSVALFASANGARIALLDAIELAAWQSLSNTLELIGTATVEGQMDASALQKALKAGIAGLHRRQCCRSIASFTLGVVAAVPFMAVMMAVWADRE